jgi:hypothetical protein
MWSIDEDRWFGVQLGERTDLIDRGQHHVGTGLGGAGDEAGALAGADLRAGALRPARLRRRRLQRSQDHLAA